MQRSRGTYAAIACLVLALGLLSRRDPRELPAFVAAYAGDTLWAMMVFLIVAVLAPAWSSARAAVVALALAYAVEATQLYRAEWIESIRETRAGGLVLGRGFLWSDIACYTVGVALCFALERGFRR